MIEILSAPDHVLALRMAGTVTGPEIDRVIEEIEARPSAIGASAFSPMRPASRT